MVHTLNFKATRRKALSAACGDNSPEDGPQPDMAISPIMVNRSLPQGRRPAGGRRFWLDAGRRFAGHMDKRACVAAWLKLTTLQHDLTFAGTGEKGLR
jgi:hypothetical protein